MEAWLVLFGSVLLSVGTGAQALRALAALKDARDNLALAGWQALGQAYSEDRSTYDSYFTAFLPFALVSGAARAKWYLRALIMMPGKVGGLRREGGELAVELVEFIRQAQVWSLIMMGSVLLLAGAAIQVVIT